MRKPSPGFWAVLILMGLLVAGGIMAQLQQSGGPGSAVTATQTGTWTVQPGNTPNTSPWLFTMAQGGNTATVSAAGAQKVDGSAVTQPVSGTLTAVTAITNPLPAGTNVIGHVITDSGLINSVPKTSCGNSVATGSTLVAVPTSATLLTSATTACIIAAVFFNTNASAATVTLTDNTATPINAVLTFSIPGNSNLIEPLYGGAFNLGVKWSASTTGLTGFVVAYQ